jgi:hypothetical protein
VPIRLRDEAGAEHEAKAVRVTSEGVCVQKAGEAEVILTPEQFKDKYISHSVRMRYDVGDVLEINVGEQWKTVVIFEVKEANGYSVFEYTDGSTVGKTILFSFGGIVLP